MKRLLLCLLCAVLLFACTPQKNVYRHALFTVSLPDGFEPVDSDSIVCFAPHSDPLHSSSITYSTTELNPYFNDFSDREYEDAFRALCGYESLSVVSSENRRVDGYDAKRIACKVRIDQGEHDLIIYAVNGDRTYFFTLLNIEGDPYIDAFDAMMRTLQFIKQ